MLTGWDLFLSWMAFLFGALGFVVGMACIANWHLNDPTNLPQQIYNAMWVLAALLGFILSVLSGIWARAISNGRKSLAAGMPQQSVSDAGRKVFDWN